MNSSSPRILYGVSSVGLGHARRSLAIAREVRRLLAGDAEVEWVAAEPALSFLKESGERVLEVSSSLRSMSSVMEGEARDGRITDMSRVARLSFRVARENYSLLRPFLSEYDILVQDEFVETLFSFMWENRARLPAKLAVVTDYVSLETRSWNPLNRLILNYANRMLRRAFLSSQVRIFADDPDSVRPKLREWMEQNSFHTVGPITGELPTESKQDLTRELLPPTTKMKNTVLVFTIGGSSIGRGLLEFVIECASYISEELDAQLVILTGPRVKLDASRLEKARGLVVVVPFTPSALRYFAMADCVVTQAGASTLNEVAALGVPCVAIPVSNHWEQQANAERFARRYGFQIVRYENLSREELVDAVRRALAKPAQREHSSSAERAHVKAAQLLLTLIKQE